MARKWYFFGDFQTLWNDVVHSVVSHEFFPCLIESRILGNYPIYAHWGWLPTFCILIACRVKIENRCRYSKQPPLIRDFFFRSSSAVGIGGSSSRSSVWALSVRHIKDNMRFSFSTFTFEPAAALLSIVVERSHRHRSHLLWQLLVPPGVYSALENLSICIHFFVSSSASQYILSNMHYLCVWKILCLETESKCLIWPIFTLYQTL